MDAQLRQLVTTLGEAWEPEPALSLEAVVLIEAALNRPLPAPLRALYQIANGATVYPVEIFTIRELIDVNQSAHPAVPSAVFFASDGADGFFLVDVDNSMGTGPGAVLWIDRGFIAPGAARPCAPDLFAFLADVGRGQQVWLDESRALGQQDLKAMVGALRAHPERWLGGAPAPLVDIFARGRDLGASLPKALQALLSISNGLVIPKAQIEIWPLAQIEAVQGRELQPGMPEALWFAEDQQARRYALTLLGGRTPYSNDVLMVRADETAPERFATVPLLGSLPRMVLNWLEIGP
jgi:hypothetical protein